MIDINCDMGESFGSWQMGHDDKIMPYIHSANIACGFHAGDPHIMRQTVQCAIAHGVKIGAHPGINDLQGFGRRPIPLSPQEAYDLVVYQIGALSAVCRTLNTKLHHVKLHGALYNMAAQQEDLAKATAQAVYDVDPSLEFFVLANSPAVKIAQDIGLSVKQEVFADRRYQADGRLTPRHLPNAMITDIHQAIDQVITMAKHAYVLSHDGQRVPIQADTLCLHGDQENALVFAQGIREALAKEQLL